MWKYHEIWSKFGFRSSILKFMELSGVGEPSSIQQLAITKIMKGDNTIVAAPTGTGKTLAYLLPIIEKLKRQEEKPSTSPEIITSVRMYERPRAVILVPTRELANQVLATTKQIANHVKIASCGIYGGSSLSIQKKSLKQGPVDILVASPGRLIKLRDRERFQLSQTEFLVLDEVDTMIEEGFEDDLRQLLKPLLFRPPTSTPVQFVLVTATITPKIESIAKRGGLSSFLSKPVANSASSSSHQGAQPLQPQRVAVSVPETTSRPFQIIKATGLHQLPPNSKVEFVHLSGRDRIVALLELLHSDFFVKRNTTIKPYWIIFCNTIPSCRAVQHAVQARFDSHQSLTDSDHVNSSLGFHAGMNSNARQANVLKLKQGNVDVLVCTDIASRGLDFPNLTNVVMFDFPTNVASFVHRAGRAGRLGGVGNVKITCLVGKGAQAEMSHKIQISLDSKKPLEESFNLDKKLKRPDLRNTQKAKQNPSSSVKKDVVPDRTSKKQTRFGGGLGKKEKNKRSKQLTKLKRQSVAKQGKYPTKR